MTEQLDVHKNNILEASIGTDDIIHITVGGNIMNEHLIAFTDWTEKVKRLIHELSERNPEHIFILSDVSGIAHFERKPIVQLRDLFEYDKQYPVKSAIVGATGFTRPLLDAVISLAGRTNIQQFETKEEALQWFKQLESAGA